MTDRAPNHAARAPSSDRRGVSIGLLSNPHSGRNLRRLPQIRRIVADYPGVHHFITRDPEGLAPALEEMGALGVEVLAINGGDGTVSRVLTELLVRRPIEPLPRIALLPGGTTNMNTGDVGSRGRLPGAVRRLCRWGEVRGRPCETRERPPLRVEVPGQRPVCGMFLGAGAIIQGIEFCHAEIHSRGVGSEIGPGLAMARTVWGILRRDPRFSRPVSMSVALDGGPASAPGEVLLLLASGLERLFLGMRPYWGVEGGPLHLTLVRDGAERFLRHLPSLLRGAPGPRATPEAGYASHDVRLAELHFDGTYTLDGELYLARRAAGPVRIQEAERLTFLRL